MNRGFIARSACLVGFILALQSGGVLAQTQGGPPQSQGQGQGGDHPHGPPPPEAIAACQGKASGATCSFVGRQGEQLTGYCFTPPPRGAGGPQGGQQAGQQNSAPPQGNSDNQGTRPLACRPERGGN